MIGDHVKTVYLSGPMTGLPGLDYKAFDQAAANCASGAKEVAGLLQPNDDVSNDRVGRAGLGRDWVAAPDPVEPNP